MGGHVILSLIGIATLLLARDRASLSQQENAGATALLSSGALLIALSVSDFLPTAFLGLSGIGAAVLAFTLASGPGSDLRRIWGEVLMMVVVCGTTAALLAGPLQLGSADEEFRLSATLLALLLAARGLARAIRRRPAANQSLIQALAHADTSNLDRFLDALAEQPLLAGLRIGEGAILSDYDAPTLSALMGQGPPVWTQAGLAHLRPAATRACDELADLMAKTEATHAMMVSRFPLRIALLTLPDIGPAPDVDAQLAVFRKLAFLASEGPR